VGFIVSGFLSGKVDARGVSVRGRDECPDTCLTGFSEIFGSNPTVGSCVFIAKATVSVHTALDARPAYLCCNA